MCQQQWWMSIVPRIDKLNKLYALSLWRPYSFNMFQNTSLWRHNMGIFYPRVVGSRTSGDAMHAVNQGPTGRNFWDIPHTDLMNSLSSVFFSPSLTQQQKGLYSQKWWLYGTSNNTACLCYQLSGLGDQWLPASRAQTVHVHKPRQFLLMFTEIKTVPLWKWCQGSLFRCPMSLL